VSRRDTTTYRQRFTRAFITSAITAIVAAVIAALVAPPGHAVPGATPMAH
jgi:hypothetical protein